MLQRNNPYRNTYVPLSQYTGEGGYYHTILSTSGKSFFLNLGASALLGYEAVNNGNRLLDDGASLRKYESFIYGGAALPAAAISSMEPESNTFSNLKKNIYP